MIEVERKFLLDDATVARLTADADFLSERTFTDTYWDTETYALSLHDTWLRQREDKFELKVPLLENTQRLTDQYEEVLEDHRIRQILHLPIEGDWPDVLAQNGYAPFCICTTTRRKYRIGEIILDLDTVRFEDFTYHIGELELHVDHETEVEMATERLLEFAEEAGLEIAPVRGKVIEFLRRKKPEHYRALVQAGVVREK